MIDDAEPVGRDNYGGVARKAIRRSRESKSTPSGLSSPRPFHQGHGERLFHGANMSDHAPEGHRFFFAAGGEGRTHGRAEMPGIDFLQRQGAAQGGPQSAGIRASPGTEGVLKAATRQPRRRKNSAIKLVRTVLPTPVSVPVMKSVCRMSGYQSATGWKAPPKPDKSSLRRAAFPATTRSAEKLMQSLVEDFLQHLRLGRAMSGCS